MQEADIGMCFGKKNILEIYVKLLKNTCERIQFLEICYCSLKIL